MDPLPTIGKVTGFEELSQPTTERPGGNGSAFAETLKEAVLDVDALQHESESAQLSFARQADVDLHDVLIKI